MGNSSCAFGSFLVLLLAYPTATCYIWKVIIFLFTSSHTVGENGETELWNELLWLCLMFTKSALYVLALTVAVPSFRCGQRLTLAAEAEMLHHHLGHHRDTKKRRRIRPGCEIACWLPASTQETGSAGESGGCGVSPWTCWCSSWSTVIFMMLCKLSVYQSRRCWKTWVTADDDQVN